MPPMIEVPYLALAQYLQYRKILVGQFIWFGRKSVLVIESDTVYIWQLYWDKWYIASTTCWLVACCMYALNVYSIEGINVVRDQIKEFAGTKKLFRYCICLAVPYLTIALMTTGGLACIFRTNCFFASFYLIVCMSVCFSGGGQHRRETHHSGRGGRHDSRRPGSTQER